MRVRDLRFAICDLRCGPIGNRELAIANRQGLSLIEVMISLVISAMLLTAVAAAFSASASAIDINDRFFRASQSARVSMNQMLSAIRRCQSCRVGDVADPPTDVVSANDIHIITADGEFRIYKYFATDSNGNPERKLKLIRSDVLTDTAYPLASNITSATFTGVFEQDPKTLVRRMVRVTVDLVVQIGDDQIRLSGSAVPRRAMVY